VAANTPSQTMKGIENGVGRAEPRL